MKKLTRTILFSILVFGAGHLQYANAQDPGPVPCEPSPFQDCPIDGGLSLLLGIGVLYGFLKARSSGMQEKEDPTVGSRQD